MSCDLYLAPHAPALVAAIRRRALKQYLVPYVTVDLRAMAAAFHMDAEKLEDELAELIASGEVAMRIDAHAKTLRAHVADVRADALRAAVDTSDEFVEDGNRMLLRAAAELDGLVQGAKGSRGRATATAAAAAASAVGAGGAGAGVGAGGLAAPGAPNSAEASAAASEEEMADASAPIIPPSMPSS